MSPPPIRIYQDLVIADAAADGDRVVVDLLEADGFRRVAFTLPCATVASAAAETVQRWRRAGQRVTYVAVAGEGALFDERTLIGRALENPDLDSDFV